MKYLLPGCSSILQKVSQLYAQVQLLDNRSHYVTSLFCGATRVFCVYICIFKSYTLVYLEYTEYSFSHDQSLMSTFSIFLNMCCDYMLV